MQYRLLEISWFLTKFASVRTNTGTPSNSVNCLVAAGLAGVSRGTDAMRVPSPAAGIMTNTFMRAISIYEYRSFRPNPNATAQSGGATNTQRMASEFARRIL